MGGEYISKWNRRYDMGKLSLQKKKNNRGRVTSPQYFQLCSGRNDPSRNIEVIHDPVSALSLVAPWANIDNHNINGHRGRGVGLRG